MLYVDEELVLKGNSWRDKCFWNKSLINSAQQIGCQKSNAHNVPHTNSTQLAQGREFEMDTQLCQLWPEIRTVPKTARVYH